MAGRNRGYLNAKTVWGLLARKEVSVDLKATF